MLGPNFNRNISFPTVFPLFTSFGAFFLAEPLLSYSAQNPQDHFINTSIQFLLFILVPVNFFLANVSIILSAVMFPNSPQGEMYAAQVDQLKKMTVRIATASLLAGVGIGAYVGSRDVALGGLKAAFQAPADLI